MGNKAVLGSFVAVLALITYRDFRHPDPTWPLGPVPPPYRYAYAAVVFGIIGFVSDIWSEQVATVVASGVLIGTIYAVISGKSAVAGLASNAPKTETQKPPTGPTGSTTSGGGAIQA